MTTTNLPALLANLIRHARHAASLACDAEVAYDEMEIAIMDEILRQLDSLLTDFRGLVGLAREAPAPE